MLGFCQFYCPSDVSVIYRVRGCVRVRGAIQGDGGIHPPQIFQPIPQINICFIPPLKICSPSPKIVIIYSRDSALDCRHMLPHLRLFLAPRIEFLGKNTSEVVYFKRIERIFLINLFGGPPTIYLSRVKKIKSILACRYE